MKAPVTLVDAASELALLGVLIRQPHRVHDDRLDRLLFADPDHRKAYDALSAGAKAGELAGDPSTAAAVLERAGIQTFRSLAAGAFLAAEDLLPDPLIQHTVALARRRQLRQLALGLANVAEHPTTHADDREAIDTIAARTADHAQLNGAGPAPWTRLDAVATETVTWLWSRRIPFGFLTLLDGDPGLGKTAVTLDLAARLTTGRPLPDDPDPPWQPAGVVLVNAEDPIAHTLRPRLEAAGADLTRIVAFDFDHLPEFPAGIATIHAAIRAVDARLVIIDPVIALIEHALNAYHDQDSRVVLRPLATLAAETGTAIVMNRHLTKQSGPKALYRGSGSIAFSAAARSVLLLAEDPDDHDCRILAPVKNNLAPPAASLRLGFDPTPDGGMFRIAWRDHATSTADQLLGPAPSKTDSIAIQDAITALESLLADGDILADDADKARKQAGISTYAWKAARAQLHVRAIKSPITMKWSLRLP